MQGEQELHVQTWRRHEYWPGEAGGTGPGAAPRPRPSPAAPSSSPSLTILSRILGLVRTLVFSQTVGASCLGTAYVTANQVPDLLYQLILGGALSQRDGPGAGPLGRAVRPGPGGEGAGRARSPRRC